MENSDTTYVKGLKQRALSLGFYLLLMLFFPTTLPAEQGKPVEVLPDLVATALANNPELKASQARWEMFRSRIDQARSLEDPMLMLKTPELGSGRTVQFPEDPMTQRVIGLSQQIPFWGKRELRGDIASREAESYRWTMEERKLELARMVKETWYRLYYTDKSRDIVARNIRILDDFVTLAETKYSVGQGVQQDVFKAQVERSKLLIMRDNPGAETKNPAGKSQCTPLPAGRNADRQHPRFRHQTRSRFRQGIERDSLRKPSVDQGFSVTRSARERQGSSWP